MFACYTCVSCDLLYDVGIQPICGYLALDLLWQHTDLEHDEIFLVHRVVLDRYGYGEKEQRQRRRERERERENGRIKKET